MQLFLAGQNSGLSPQEWQITCELFAPYAPEENPCQWYKKIFPEVRSFEAFKYLHVGMISEIKRKTLPEIARLVGLSNEQGLLHS
jgi:hypothetical protein